MNYYSAERNVQILIGVLKANGIKKIIISPGSTNVCFAYSVQQDPFFETYSVVDERSAAYMACGLSEESGEVVVLSCTGATASRNYLPGLTEAYYRKLPILVVTASQPNNRIGHNIPQVTNRLKTLSDAVKMTVTANYVRSAEDEWECETQINKAVLELDHRTKGPVHINLITLWSHDFSVKELPKTRVIKRIEPGSELPDIPHGEIGIFIGNHSRWTNELTKEAEIFCKKYNAVVLSDHTGNYKGKYFVLGNLLYSQENRDDSLNRFDLIIHLGSISGAYFGINTRNVWRVDTDGEVIDTFRKLSCIFEMTDLDFFKRYNEKETSVEYDVHQYDLWKNKDRELRDKISDFPLSNIWVARVTTSKLPAGTELHLGILNSLRSWSFFEVPESVNVYSNTGGFGIDGCMSSLIGASMFNKDKIYLGVLGDLAFFYDLNSLGNRNIGPNVRIILINNGLGTEFKNYNNNGALFGDETDEYIAAGRHYGNKSRLLVKEYATALGFDYYGVETKEDYLNVLPVIISDNKGNKPIVVEVFTDCRDESDALKAIRTLNGEKKTAQSFKRPARLKCTDKTKYVAWGAGLKFRQTISQVQEYEDIAFVCDSNDKIWGEEVSGAIKCISPETLKGMDDVFVIIMTDNYRTAFSITNQLLDMGIDNYDLVDNWLKYVKGEKKDG